MCTLLVTQDPLLARIDGFQAVWSGDGQLEFISSVGTSSIPHVPPAPASERIRADVASRRQTLDLGPRGSRELPLIVRVRNGTRFSISFVEVADGRALRWPLSAQEVATINGGTGPPCQPVLLSSSVSVSSDSIAFRIAGLGLKTTKSVIHSGRGTVELPFTVFGDTALRATVPLATAHRGRELGVISTAGTYSFIEADVRELIPPTQPAQIIALLKLSAPPGSLDAISGISRTIPIGRAPDASEGVGRTSPEDLSRVLVADVVEGQDASRILAAIRASGHVESADLVTRWGPEPFRDPSDPMFGEQWGLHEAVGLHCRGTIDVAPASSIDLPAAWEYPPLPPEVRVSIIDTGVNTAHEDVELAPQDPQFPVNASFDPNDPDWSADSWPGGGHGTPVASIASALTDNVVGMAGASWPPASYDQWGYPNSWACLPASVKIAWTWPSITRAVNFASAAQRPFVLNLSIGTHLISDTEKRTLLQACKNAFMSGHLVVAAAGNDHDTLRTYPAGFDSYVMAVGATLWNNLYWTNANAWPPSLDEVHGTKIGPWIDVTAPGGIGITAASGTGSQYSYFSLDEPGNTPCDLHNIQLGGFWVGFSGTSAAAPLVSGTAAWIKRIQPTLTGEDAWQVLQRTATDLGELGRDDYYGHGRINAAAAAAFVSRPNWIVHGELGNGSGTPLLVQADSVAGMISISNDNPPDPVPDGTYACVRYRLVGTTSFAAGFLAPPALWVRRADSQGLPAVTTWDDDEQPPSASIIAWDGEYGTFETYVYRLTTLDNRFYPCTPEEAVIAFTAVAPSGTLDVPPDSGPIALSVRTRISPARARALFDAEGLAAGPLRVEVFDVFGRRIATLFEGSFRGGRAAFEWDGNDRLAASCRAAMYVCRIEQPGRRAACRFAYLR